ncbi:hypothetical protein [Enterobacter sp. 168J2]|uniref:hypothetical protein n=1 Tax=Enterobacter sp. 168J2 TaxID=3077758 RepID=UPI00124A0823|nr:hypothetical protein [Enterobacter sp. 168J2]HBU6131242.1 hypothetical protein [Enterobacter cloacae]
MSNIDKRAYEKLKAAAAKAVDNFDPNMFVETRDVLALLDELEAKDKRITKLSTERAKGVETLQSELIQARIRAEAAEKRIAELSASHGKLREAMAGIHNTITAGGAYTPLAAILNASKRAYEESAAAAGKGE